jgi:hypothetical protein
MDEVRGSIPLGSTLVTIKGRLNGVDAPLSCLFFDSFGITADRRVARNRADSASIRGAPLLIATREGDPERFEEDRVVIDHRERHVVERPALLADVGNRQPVVPFR